MPSKIYNKLVRDRIPEIITAAGKTCTVEVLAEGDYITHLDQKLSEELAEYLAEPSLEELADLTEVIHAAVQARGWTLEELECVQVEKAAQRGGFEQRLLLKEVVEK